MTKITPITPAEASKAAIIKKKENIPEAVIEAINALIVEHFNPTGFTLYQNDLLKVIGDHLNIDRQEVFDRKYLDFEEVFRDFGWDVIYVKTPYFETADSYFKFSIKKDS